MLWRLLTKQEIDIVYEEHMKRDFPPQELPPFPPALELIACGEGWFFGIFDKENEAQGKGDFEVKANEGNGDITLEKLAAYIQVLKPEHCSYALLNYYAVLPAYRNSGLGTRLLEDLQMHLPKVKGIIIEAEIPKRAEDAKMAKRRLEFYERAGAVNTMWQEQVYDAWYYILVKVFAGGEPGKALKDLQLCYQRLFTKTQYEQAFGLWDDNGRVISGRLKHLRLNRDEQKQG